MYSAYGFSRRTKQQNRKTRSTIGSRHRRKRTIKGMMLQKPTITTQRTSSIFLKKDMSQLASAMTESITLARLTSCMTSSLHLNSGCLFLMPCITDCLVIETIRDFQNQLICDDRRPLDQTRQTLKLQHSWIEGEVFKTGSLDTTCPIFYATARQTSGLLKMALRLIWAKVSWSTAVATMVLKQRAIQLAPAYSVSVRMLAVMIPKRTMVKISKRITF